ncbi:hypothetical protein Hdeb2414_s0004g00132371 [Helianthus debilis subsp. tardiflorus]
MRAYTIISHLEFENKTLTHTHPVHSLSALSGETTPPSRFPLQPDNHQAHPTPFSSSINNRSTTTTVRWWCGGATQEREERERERLRREKEPTLRISDRRSVRFSGGPCF